MKPVSVTVFYNRYGHPERREFKDPSDQQWQTWAEQLRRGHIFEIHATGKQKPLTDRSPTDIPQRPSLI